MYIYIDESGDTGYTKKSTKHFIVTAVIVDDIFVLRRIAKDVHKYNLSNKKFNILHANKDTVNVKNKLVKKINMNNIKCVAYVFDKKQLKVKDIYKYSLERLAEYFSDNNMNNITIARKDIRKTYNKSILNIYSLYSLNAVFSDQNNEKSLQIADFYSWVIFSKYEHNILKYFTKLQSSITIIKTKPSTGL